MTARHDLPSGHRPRLAPKVVDVVTEDLRRRILAGEFDANRLLPRAIALVNAYGISRPTLREAYRVLEAEQLIRKDPDNHWNYLVQPPSAAVAARSAHVLLRAAGATPEDLAAARALLATTAGTGRAQAIMLEVLDRTSSYGVGETDGASGSPGQDLAGRIRSAILAGELTVGSRLPTEAQMREQYGVPRVAVREARRHLEVEGFLRVERGALGGASVAWPGPEPAARYLGLLLQYEGVTVGEFLQLRRDLEVAIAVAAATAVRAGTSDTLAMRRAADRETEQQGAQELVAAALDFHDAVAHSAGSPSLTVTYLLIESVLRLAAADRVAATHESQALERITAGQASHLALIEEIEAGDVAAVRDLWSAHCAGHQRPGDDDALDVFALFRPPTADAQIRRVTPPSTTSV